MWLSYRCRNLFALALSVSLLSVYFPVPATAAEQRGPSTAEERQQALALVAIVEKAPISPAADEARFQLLAWLSEIPDITVMVCPQVLGSDDEISDLPPALRVHHAFAAARYAIEHPGSRGDGLDAFVAGVVGTLRAYASLRESGTIPAHDHLDRLAALQSDKLHRFVKKRIQHCH
jgi:hypothetical protein